MSVSDLFPCGHKTQCTWVMTATSWRRSTSPILRRRFSTCHCKLEVRLPSSCLRSVLWRWLCRPVSLTCCVVLYLGQSIPRVSGPLDPLHFYRDYVSANKPVIIESTYDSQCETLRPSDAISHWPALSRWQSDEYLRENAGKHTVSVQWTPNGEFITASSAFVVTGLFLVLLD